MDRLDYLRPRNQWKRQGEGVLLRGNKRKAKFAAVRALFFYLWRGTFMQNVHSFPLSILVITPTNPSNIISQVSKKSISIAIIMFER